MISTSPLPLLSVVIPTHKRPQFLSRAISSALLAAPHGNVEVIVVPNGPDESWRIIADLFKNENRVQWHPIPLSHANSARNHGMRLARGLYIRFLDDDDTLDSSGAQHQIEVALSCEAEIISGTVDIVDHMHNFLRHMPHPCKSDFFTAMVRPNRICLPISHLFLRSAVLDYAWNETLPFEQDTDWMLRISASRKWQWIAIDDVVGYWTSHDEHRISNTSNSEVRATLSMELILQNASTLKKLGQLTEERKSAISEAIWSHAHIHFPKSPFKWTKAMKIAQQFSKPCRPPDKFYRLPIIKNINPISLEWFALPKRIFKLDNWFKN